MVSKPMRILIAARDASREWLGAATAVLPAEVRLASTGAQAEELAQREHPHVVVTDVALPDTTAAELLVRVKRHVPVAQVVVLAGRASVAQAVEFMRAGAYSVLEQPVDRDTLLTTLTNAGNEYRVHRTPDQAGPRAAVRAAHAPIIGNARTLRVMLDTLHSIAPSEANCLVVGENGTGKELVAEAIHATSARAGGPFVKINCAAIPEHLIESELFGHKKGSFTDAIADRQGLFEQANGGSLFLDEIGEMPPFLQAKLLRVLQEREFRPIGDSRTIGLDARLICATNVDVAKAVRERRLREDLLFRINTITLQVPPLRDRMEDIAVLCAHFLGKFADRYERRFDGISKAALETMSRYHWPGNIRELESVIERAVLLTDTSQIDVSALPIGVRRRANQCSPDVPELMTLVQIERRAVMQALERSQWNVERAAVALGIRTPTLYAKMRRFGIQRRAPASVPDGRIP